LLDERPQVLLVLTEILVGESRSQQRVALLGLAEPRVDALGIDCQKRHVLHRVIAV
jgi:hypothetical protein